MSQYPPPYPPQQPSYYGASPPPSPEELLRPARRAGVLMIVLGVLFVVGGLCFAGVSYALRTADFSGSAEGRDLQQQINELEARFGRSVSKMLIISGAVFLGTGALLGTLGVFVRGGRRGPVIGGIVLTILLALFLALEILRTVAASVVFGMPPAQTAMGVCLCVVPLGMLCLLLVWLVQAVRMAPHIDAARVQFQNQVAYYQQQQQYYQQPPPGVAPPPGPPHPPAQDRTPWVGPAAGTGGYHQLPPTPPPSAPPASPSSSEGERRDDSPSSHSDRG